MNLNVNEGDRQTECLPNEPFFFLFERGGYRFYEGTENVNEIKILDKRPWSGSYPAMFIQSWVGIMGVVLCLDEPYWSYWAETDWKKGY